MKTYEVTVWASYTTQIEANSEEEAEEIAINEASFPYADYCEIEEI